MGHIFISYSHKDTDYAHRLADTLQAEGFDVWIDARLDYGSQWPQEIQRQLDSSEAFILIMTPRSFASDWVQSELQRAKRKLKPIFPLLLEGDEPWLSVESIQYYDVRAERLPDAKFYSALGRVVSRREGQALQLPADQGQKPVRPKLPASPPKVRTTILIGILGAVALLVAAIPILWSSFAARTPPSPSDGTPEPGTTDEEMSLVQAGEFLMGSTLEEALAECQKYSADCFADAFEDEQPPHPVLLEACYIDVYEVSNVLYADCVDAGVCQPPVETSSATRSSYFRNPEYDHYPVIYVSWEMAQTYCEWRGARLPTEAEWEKAARGTEERIYPWGNEFDSSYVNANDETGDTAEARDYEEGQSPYGLYDMAGNVWEWVADYYSGTYYQESPFSNPPGPDSGQAHVLRGGSWYDPAPLLRTTVRLMEEHPVDNNFGFRCARDADF